MIESIHSRKKELRNNVEDIIAKCRDTWENNTLETPEVKDSLIKETKELRHQYYLLLKEIFENNLGQNIKEMYDMSVVSRAFHGLLIDPQVLLI